MAKSANQLWKESGTTLPFKKWIEREKEKFSYQSNNDFVNVDGLKLDTSGLKVNLPSSSAKSSSSVFGLSAPVLIVSGLLVATAVGIYFYRKAKK